MNADDLNPDNLTEEQLNRMLVNSIRLTLVLSFALGSLLAVLRGWPDGVLLLVGGLISASGILEWKRMVRALTAHFDASGEGRATGWVVVLFLVRLVLAAGVLYVSLKFLHGSPYSLVGGLGLAVISLTFQALRLLRSSV